MTCTVFSLNFSSAGKGPFFSWPERQKKCARGALSSGEGGSGVRDMSTISWQNLGTKFPQTSFPHFKTYFMQISRCYL